MGSNISINKEIEKYINNHSLELNETQKEVISYNDRSGKIDISGLTDISSIIFYSDEIHDHCIGNNCKKLCIFFIEIL